MVASHTTSWHCVVRYRSWKALIATNESIISIPYSIPERPCEHTTDWWTKPVDTCKLNEKLQSLSYIVEVKSLLIENSKYLYFVLLCYKNYVLYTRNNLWPANLAVKSWLNDWTWLFNCNEKGACTRQEENRVGTVISISRYPAGLPATYGASPTQATRLNHCQAVNSVSSNIWNDLFRV